MQTPTPAPTPSPGYRVKLETVTGTGGDIVLRSLLDRIQYHDPDGEAERAGVPPASWALFGLLWPSGRVLAHAMQTFDLRGKAILELGCGLALASLVIHRRGGDVTASDCHPEAAGFLRENLRLNRLLPMKYLVGNWATPNPGLGLFDLVIGSDVLYDRGHPEALSQFIGRHTHPRAEVLVVDPDRGNHAGFTRRMALLGFSHSSTRVKSLPDGAPYKGGLHRYLRPPA